MNLFWRVSADTKTCPSTGYRLPAGKHKSILTYIQTKINKKMTKKLLFLFILLALRSLIVSGEAGSTVEVSKGYWPGLSLSKG